MLRTAASSWSDRQAASAACSATSRTRTSSRRPSRPRAAPCGCSISRRGSSQYDRAFRPTQIVRIVEPVSGTPRIRVRCDPRLGWSKRPSPQTMGSNHVRFEGFSSQLRLTTDIPISYLSGQPFALTERRHLVLTWGAPVEEPLAGLCSSASCRQTLSVLAALGQGVRRPAPLPAGGHPLGARAQAALLRGHGRHRGGDDDVHPRGAGQRPDLGLPLLLAARRLLRAVGVPPARPLRGARAVRALPHQRRQLDAGPRPGAALPHRRQRRPRRTDPRRAGRASTATARCAWETRRPHSARTTCSARWCSRCLRSSSTSASAAERSPATLDLLQRLARKAVAVAGTPDAGIWELRGRPRAQTFSSLMCWAAADRMANVAARCCREQEAGLRAAAGRIREEILSRAWSDRTGSLVASYEGGDLDAFSAAGGQLASARRRRPAPANDGRSGGARSRARRVAGALSDRRRVRDAQSGVRAVHVLARGGAGGHREVRRRAGAPRAGARRRFHRWACSPRITRPTSSACGATSRRPTRTSA